jgi:hypothetical protein
MLLYVHVAKILAFQRVSKGMFLNCKGYFPKLLGENPTGLLFFLFGEDAASAVSPLYLIRSTIIRLKLRYVDI